MNEEKEIWKQVKGYEGLYNVSNKGQYYSYPREGTKGGYSYGSTNGKNGYLKIGLTNQSITEYKYMHILVWETFVGAIPEGYDVHHINHNRQDNRLKNLCLMEHKKHMKEHNDKPILQYTLDGVFVAEYQSATEASRQTCVDIGAISKCCNEKKGFKSAGNYIWRFKNVA